MALMEQSVLFLLAVCIISCSSFVSAEPKKAMAYQLDHNVKPCIMSGKNCPRDGSMGNLNRMEQDIPEMIRDAERDNRRVPAECDCLEERCVRECWYSLMKESLLSEYDNYLTEFDRRRRG